MWEPIAESVRRAAGAEASTPIDLEKDSEFKFSDGRTFRISTLTTSRQDMFIMTRLDRAGLDALGAAATDPTKLDALAMELVANAYDADLLFEILAGILSEDGVAWSKDAAMRNAEYFANLTNPADKTLIQGPIVSILLLYFISGLASKETFPKSSEEAGNAEESAVSPSETPAPVGSSPSAPSASVPPDVLAHLRAEGSTVVTGT